jgi:hypothetical protein
MCRNKELFRTPRVITELEELVIQNLALPEQRHLYDRVFHKINIIIPPATLLFEKILFDAGRWFSHV